MADALVDSLEFLTTTRREYPARHRSLRAVFAYSWQLLLPAEQQALARISVFRGSFSREAAQVVAQANVVVLAALVDKSLLRGRSGSAGMPCMSCCASLQANT